jgi:hypothetical protein
MKYKNSLLDKIKSWRIKISRLDEIVFSNTSIVEKEELYIIDYEGYQREILKILPKNNDDLNVVTKGS